MEYTWVTDELSGTVGCCLDETESVCSDDNICYSHPFVGYILLFTDFGDELSSSDGDDDLEQLANLEQNDDLDNLEQNNSVMISSAETLTFVEPSHMQQPFDAVGYAIIGDDIDKNVWPSYQQQDCTMQSLHYFYFYSIKNCINIFELSDKHPSFIDISPTNIFPSQLDVKMLIKEYDILISKYACMWLYLRL